MSRRLIGLVVLEDFVSWVLHPLYRLSRKSTLSPDRTFPSLFKEGGTEVFLREKKLPFQNFFAGLLHTAGKKLYVLFES